MKKLIALFLMISLALGGLKAANAAKSLPQDGVEAQMARYRYLRGLHTRPVAKIKTEFDKQFPRATDVEWKMSDGIYEIEFELNRIDHEAWYDSDANLLMFTREVRTRNIPAVIRNAVSANHPEYKIDEAHYFEMGTQKGYIIELEHRRTDAEWEVIYDESGKMIK